MADNVLKAIISVTAPGAQQAFTAVAGGAAKTEAALTKIGGPAKQATNDIAALATKLKQGAGGFQIIGEAGQLAGSRMRSLGGVLNTTASSISAITPAAQGAVVSFGRLVASFLSAQVIGQLFQAAFNLVVKVLDDAKPAFDQAALSASVFKDRLEELKTTADKLKKSLDFKTELASLDFKIAFGEGTAADLNDINLKIADNNKVIIAAGNDVNKLSGTYNTLKSTIDKAIESLPRFEKKLGSAVLVPTAIGQLEKAGKTLLTLSKEELKELPKDQRTIIESFQNATTAITAAQERGAKAFQDNIKLIKQSALISANEVRKLNEPVSVGGFKPIKAKDLVDIPSIAQLFQDFVLPPGSLDNFQKSFRDAMLGSQRALSLDEEISKNINDSLQRAADKIKPIVIPVKVDLKKAEIQAQFADLVDDLNSIFAQGFADISASIGESLGAAFSGQGGALKGILDTIAGFISQIGKALIKYGIVKAGLDKILSAGGVAIPGAVAIALGIAAIAAAALLKNVSGRAAGGPVIGGQPYIVGERGPEIFVPNTGGQIVPNRGAGGWMGGMGQAGKIQVVFVQRGADLIGTIDIANQSLRRLV